LESGGARAAGPAAAGDPPPPATAQEVVPPTTSPTAESAPADDPPPAEEEEAEGPPTSEPEAKVPQAADPEPSAAMDPPAGGADLGDRHSPNASGGGTKSGSGPAGQEPSSAAQSDLSFSDIQQAWPAVLQKLAETAPALAATFEGARPTSFDGAGLQIGFPPEMTFNKKKADSPERRDTLAAAFAAVTGVGLRPTYVLLSEDEASPPDTPAPGSDEVDEEELLERLKSDFDAEEVG
jgi:hypothetical protein